MPARRRTTTSSVPDSPQSDDGSLSKADAYRLKRQRNNDAVKKARAKSKETADVRKQHIKKLRAENENLEGQISAKKQHVQDLKKLLLTNVKTEEQNALIQRIIEESDEDEADSK